MRIPKLGLYIVQSAASYVTPEDICYEKTKNKGNCIDELKCIFEGKEDYCNSSEIGSEAYCASSGWAFVEVACRRYGCQNILPHTKGARDMLNKSYKTDLRVDENPFPGCVFYRTSTAAGASGHIGIVVQLDSDVFHTIEGNMSFTYEGKKYEGVWGRYYKYDEIQSRGFKFIHTEEMAGTDDMVDMEYSESTDDGTPVVTATKNVTAKKAMLPLLLIGGTAAYFFFKGDNKRKKGV